MTPRLSDWLGVSSCTIEWAFTLNELPVLKFTVLEILHQPGYVDWLFLLNMIVTCHGLNGLKWAVDEIVANCNIPDILYNSIMKRVSQKGTLLFLVDVHFFCFSKRKGAER